MKLATGDVYRYVGVETLASPNLTGAAQSYGENPDWEKGGCGSRLGRRVGVESTHAPRSASRSRAGPSTARGDVLAVGDQVVTNLILSSANAFVVGSDLTTKQRRQMRPSTPRTRRSLTPPCSAPPSRGDARLRDHPGVQHDRLKSRRTSSSTPSTPSSATPLVSSAFNGEQPALTQAYMANTLVHVAGDLTLRALKRLPQLNATVSNTGRVGRLRSLRGPTARPSAARSLAIKVNRPRPRALSRRDGWHRDRRQFLDDSTPKPRRASSPTARSSRRSITINDGGASILQETINDFLSADHPLQRGGRGLSPTGIGSGWAITSARSDYSSDDGYRPLALGSKVSGRRRLSRRPPNHEFGAVCLLCGRGQGEGRRRVRQREGVRPTPCTATSGPAPGWTWVPRDYTDDTTWRARRRRVGSRLPLSRRRGDL